jgi:two-component system KDP operon response regulator KdpE
MTTADAEGGGDAVLVIEDAAPIARALRAALSARGYRPVLAPTGQGGIDAAAVEDPSVIILDLGLPDMDGVDVCRRIRTWSDVPIIVLTAADDERRKITALDAGADDYVTKPFSTPELLARLRVAVRRHRARRASAVDGAVAASTFTVGDLVVDVAHHRVDVSGERVELTPKEFGFLEILSRYPGRVLTHRMILQEVWGPEYGSETQYLRVYASQLRKKLKDDPTRPRLVTEPGVGYRLVDPDAPD